MSPEIAAHSQPCESEASSILSLPTELILNALELIPVKDLLSVRETSKFFGDLVKPLVFRTVTISNRPERSRAPLSEATRSHTRTIIKDRVHGSAREYTQLHDQMPTAGVCVAGESWNHVREVIITGEMTIQIAAEEDMSRGDSD